LRKSTVFGETGRKGLVASLLPLALRLRVRRQSVFVVLLGLPAEQKR
jgi:hypothetical protein